MKIPIKAYMAKYTLNFFMIADLLGTVELHLNTLEKARYHQTNQATRSQVYQPTDRIQIKKTIFNTCISIPL